MPWGSVLGTTMVKSELYLKKTLPPGTFSDPAKVSGRTLLFPVKAGEPILESKLAPASAQQGGVGAIITPKKRAIAVKVDKVIGVSGYIKPGSRVDVLVTLSKGGEGSNNPITKTALENILVLAVGSEMEKSGKEEKPTPVDVITLEVTPEEGEKLALAATEGKLQMALRNSSDTAEVNTPGTTIPALLSSYSGPAPVKPSAKRSHAVRQAPPKPKTFTVELIRGTAVSTQKFERGE
jgi:pilus assembly protein CpaB